jgi:hypothetical protein
VPSVAEAPSARLLAIGAICLLTAATTLAGQELKIVYSTDEGKRSATYRLMEDGTLSWVGPESGPVISGVVMDPHGRGLEDIILTVARVNDGFGPGRVPIAADGSFVSPPLEPGTYVLELVRTPDSVEHHGAVFGSTSVVLDTADVSGVTIEVRRETAVKGQIRMESDDPAAEPLITIAVHALLALDGVPPGPGIFARVDSAGGFVLRDVFGPRVLRCGYTSASLAPNARWWPSRVILDGMDITNVPTDFSEHENGELELVFTQHPARITGLVTDGDRQPVKGAWVMAVPADPASWQPWATTSTAVQAGADGKFSIPLLPGEYRVNAVPERTFPSYDAALKGMLRLPHPEVTIVSLGEWQVETVNLTLHER